VNAQDFVLRPYLPADEDGAIELWRRTWQLAYAGIDFTARLGWWRERWRGEIVPGYAIIVADIVAEPPGASGNLAGFVSLDVRTGYLDQIVVAPEFWGSSAAAALIGAAKKIAPSAIELHVNCDNARAIRFYEKHGFVYAGEDKNPVSGIAVNRMTWRA
jgi:putative acetyltransferase